jgi:hypothetical protein
VQNPKTKEKLKGMKVKRILNREHDQSLEVQLDTILPENGTSPENIYILTS